MKGPVGKLRRQFSPQIKTHEIEWLQWGTFERF